EFGIRHRGSTVPERSGVALSFCRRPHPNIHEELPNQMHYLVAPRPAHEDVNFLKNIETNSSGLPRQTANTINLPTTNYLRKLNLEAEQHWAKHDAKHEQIRRDHFTSVFP
ncbi:hypothetical protein, partial [Pseudomonas helleri]|uniref:hypothetical protein n=1 Tax=Pseudomonas helleri TaxID=1608996 RepID=UPI001E37F04D